MLIHFMKRLGLAVFFVLVAVESGMAAPIDAYVIGSGDVLEISIWKDQALSRQVVVLPDGLISFPLVGELKAAGKTLAAFKDEFKEKIQTFVPDPVLSVIVQQVNSLQIYVIGKVNGPGRYVLNTNVNVLQALSMAGGLNPFAKKDKIKVIRETDGQTVVYPFDYETVVNDTKLDQNIMLRRGDVVVVP